MSAVTDAAATLSAALASVEGVRVYELGASVDPPGVVVGVPRLVWGAYSPEITSASFPVYLVVSMDDKSVRQLLTLAPLVAAAIEVATGATVDAADPGIYPVGDLPAYLFTAEFPLT
ncbi:hypothetical protein [Amycolatopsis sp. H20-H5]|uniref:hypothetical protein n=1 Tax=Amycolatopsis sp. H20-H5 TaxID=3046309 RepID=UPI002DBB8338|nr:hypothetical protein [Amycolatopsis sp. H20-H5]MEC3975090.1 hypothetical protein [Amycolatopsis sp. H20-H5]